MKQKKQQLLHLLNKNYIYPLTGIILLYILISGLFAGSIPVVWPDEVLFYSPASDLIQYGRLSTTVLSGFIPGMERYTFWMPPFYLISLSGYMALWGQSLENARMFSSILAIFIGLILFRLSLNRGLGTKSIWVIVLLFSDFLFMMVNHSVRMEGLSMLLGILSLLPFHEKNFFWQKNKFFLAGLFSSLSFLSHPFGAVYAFLSFVLVFTNKENRLKNGLLFFLGICIPLSFWIFYIYPEMDLFLFQFGAQLSRKRELLQTFGPLDRVKIILSGYRFGWLKITHYFLVFFVLIYSFKKEMLNPFFRFLLLWLLTIIFAIFVSTESWYVVHLVPPLVLITVYLLHLGRKFYSWPFLATIVLNGLLLFWVIIVHYFLIDTPVKTVQFYQELEKEMGNRKRIYLQSIPDPYFYLKERHPEKIFHEFIPGELSIAPELFMDEVKKQDMFVFYNMDHVNHFVKKFLDDNSDIFIKKNIDIKTGFEKDLKLRAVIYKRK